MTPTLFTINETSTTVVYNWGTRTKQWTMTDGGEVTCAYKYVGILWLFRFATKKTWYVGAQRVTRAELEHRYGDDTPNLDPWSAYGLIIGIALIALFIIYMFAGGS